MGSTHGTNPFKWWVPRPVAGTDLDPELCLHRTAGALLEEAEAAISRYVDAVVAVAQASTGVGSGPAADRAVRAFYALDRAVRWRLTAEVRRMRWTPGKLR